MHLLCWQSKAGIWSCGWCISCWLSGLPLFVGYLPESVQQSSSNVDHAGSFEVVQQMTNTLSLQLLTIKPRHLGFVFVHSILSSWVEGGILWTRLICFVCLLCQTLEISQISAQTGRFTWKWTYVVTYHAFLYVNTACLWGARLLKLFIEWQLLSYCIICKTCFDRFNKWIVRRCYWNLNKVMLSKQYRGHICLHGFIAAFLWIIPSRIMTYIIWAVIICCVDFKVTSQTNSVIFC